MVQVIESLQQIRHFTGHPGKFWPSFLEHTARLADAMVGVLLLQGKESGTWKKLSCWQAKNSNISLSSDLLPAIKRVAEASVTNRNAWHSMKITRNKDTNIVVLGFRLELYKTERSHIAVYLLNDLSTEIVKQIATRIKLVADTPAIYQRWRAAQQAMNGAAICSEVLDLMVLLNEEKRYLAATMTYVNEVASRYRCSSVNLGWFEKGYVRLQAISHMDRFKKNMDIVQTLEAAMEEAFDQNEEILWPPPRKNTAVVRAHETFSKEQSAHFIISLPIRLDDAPVGVLTCERNEKPFSETEILGLRVLCDQSSRRLGDLKENDRWLGARMTDAFRKKASQLFGVEHTFAKCITLLICGVLVFLLFGKLQYRVEAPFILRSDDVRYLPAPFKGYIDEVHVQVGEEVEEGDLLLNLDTRELLLEESAAIANQIRYSRDAEKARAENALADMKIALAQMDQAKAQLDLVRYRLSRAEVRAPYKGVVIEGNLKELKGAPVAKGDVLFKVSQIEKMYAELEVSERDIHELAVGASGEIVFVSQPQMKFPIAVEQIDPVALAKKKEGNIFLVRSVFSEGAGDWWKPGMSGVAKVTVGKRNVLWILMHRTVEFFRIRLWW